MITNLLPVVHREVSFNDHPINRDLLRQVQGQDGLQGRDECHHEERPARCAGHL